MQGAAAWVNGAIVSYDQAALPVWDLGVVAGASISEMARTFRHQPFRLARHLDRLTSSCRTLGFNLPYTANELKSAVAEILMQNVRLIDADADLGIVAFVTAGANATYLGHSSSGAGHVVIHTFPLPFAMWRDGMKNGVRLRIPDQPQIPAECFPIRHKVRNRLHWWLADRAVSEHDPGSRALLVDSAGYVTETSTSCFYAVINGGIVTPEGPVLTSMTRQVVQELAGHLGIPFEQRRLHRNELTAASEAFLSSTPSCLLPVSRIDGQVVGGNTASASVVTGDSGGSDGSVEVHCTREVTDQLLAAWSRMAGLDIRHQIMSAS